MTGMRGRTGIVIVGACAAVLVAAMAAGLAGVGNSLRGDFMKVVKEYTSEPTLEAGERGASEPLPDVLYKWVDSHGVTHYSQEPRARQAERMELDGKSITPLEPVDAGLAAKLARITEEPEADKPQGSQMLHNLRKELQENQQRMQEAKAAMTNDL